jgi:hypothetical protein
VLEIRRGIPHLARLPLQWTPLLLLVTFPINKILMTAAAAARIAADLDKRVNIPPTIPTNYGQAPPPPPPSAQMTIAAPPPPPPPSALPVPPPPSHAAAPPPPSIAVVVKKDERGPLGDFYQQDGDWMKDIEINNLRNRYLLTKAATQQQVLLPPLSLTARHG